MKNSAVEKFNVTDLTENQKQQLAKIEGFVQQQLQQSESSIAVIEGAAGTGKSVILTKLFEKLQTGAKNPTSPYYGLKNKLFFPAFCHKQPPSFIGIYKLVVGLLF